MYSLPAFDPEPTWGPNAEPKKDRVVDTGFESCVVTSHAPQGSFHASIAEGVLQVASFLEVDGTLPPLQREQLCRVDIGIVEICVGDVRAGQLGACKRASRKVGSCEVDVAQRGKLKHS